VARGASLELGTQDEVAVKRCLQHYTALHCTALHCTAKIQYRNIVVLWPVQQMIAAEYCIKEAVGRPLIITNAIIRRPPPPPAMVLLLILLAAPATAVLVPGSSVAYRSARRPRHTPRLLCSLCLYILDVPPTGPSQGNSSPALARLSGTLEGSQGLWVSR
jgi:hypothetical protein